MAENSHWWTGVLRRLGSRVGLLWIWICLQSGCFGAALYWNYERETFLRNRSDWEWFGVAAASIVLPLVLLALDPKDNYAKGPRSRLPIVTLVMLLALALVSFLDSSRHWNLFVGASQAPIRLAFFELFTIVFIARVWNAANYAAFDVERREERAKEAKREFLREYTKRYPDADRAALERQFEEKNSEGEQSSIGALLITLIATVIGILAFLAGNGTSFSLQATFGFFLCFAFVAMFVIVVFVDLFERLPLVRSIGRALDGLEFISKPLDGFYRWIDSGLVRIAAPVTGMSHRSTRMRYLVLTGTMFALVVMGLYLPPPYGLVPAFAAFALAIAVSRLWNWVEEDRSLAALTAYKSTAPYQTDLTEDYLDETLLAFSFVFLIAPIAMMQASDGQIFGAHLFENAAARRVEDWIGFFGLQLANALPILGWAQVYGIQTNVTIDIDSAASRHAVFLSRIMIDLVLVAALIQAIGVLTRNRQQKALYRAGHIDRLDPFVERAEFARAIQATKNGEGFDLSKLSAKDMVDFRTYNEAQLRFLFASDQSTIKREFISSIATQRGISLSPAIVTTIDLAQSNGDQVDLINSFTRAENDHRAKQHLIGADDLEQILLALRERTGLRDLKLHVVNLLEEIATPSEIVEVLTDLVEGEAPEKFLYARRHMDIVLKRARERVSEEPIGAE